MGEASDERRRPPTGRCPLRDAVAVLVLTGLAAAGGCDTSSGTSFTPWQDALPQADALLYAFPDLDPVAIRGGALSVTAAPLVGAQSELYAAARDTARTVNLGLNAFASLVERVVKHVKPHRVGPNRVVWRGGAPGSLDEDLLVMQRADDGHFEYALWSRERLRPSAAWRFRLYGSTTPVDGARRGRGVAWVDLEGDRLPATHGKVLALWENLADRKEVAVTFFAATPDGATPVRTRSFLFTWTRTGSVMTYGPELMDVHDDPAKTAVEEVRLLTRWNARGVGRSDAAVTGGDVAADGLALLIRTECWASPDHQVTYEATAVRTRTATGAGPLTKVSESGARVACPLPDPEAAVVPPIGAEPMAPPLPPEASDQAP